MNETVLIPRSCLKPKRRRGARRSSRAIRRTRRRRSRRRGLTAIEYCFILSIILIGILLAVQHFGGTLKASFNHSESKMQQIGL